MGQHTYIYIYICRFTHSELSLYQRVIQRPNGFPLQRSMVQSIRLHMMRDRHSNSLVEKKNRITGSFFTHRHTALFWDTFTLIIYTYIMYQYYHILYHTMYIITYNHVYVYIIYVNVEEAGIFGIETIVAQWISKMHDPRISNPHIRQLSDFPYGLFQVLILLT